MNAVETTSPKISDQASPLNTGSRVIGQAPSIAAPAVSRIGRNRTAPLSISASFSVAPRRGRAG